MKENQKKVFIEVDGKKWEMPTFKGNEDEWAMDISALRQQTGLITYDPGFGNSSSCQSAITFLDGEKGVLRYRGIPIEELAEKASFLETAYLLIFGKLPATKELEQFTYDITHHTLLPEDLVKLYDGLPRQGHPMAVLSTMINALPTFYPNDLDPQNKEANYKNIVRLIGKFPTIAAWAYRTSHEWPRTYPNNQLDYCSNFMNMMFALPTDTYTPLKEAVSAINLLLILHADHEQNCSTSTVRTVGSSGANIFASVAAGVNALWGPLHGGANQAVLEMLQEIHQSGGDIQKYINLAKDKNSTFRLMGFGHRVYKNFDPRATLIKKSCDQLLKKLKVDNPLLEIAKQLEEAALKDSYFVEKKLYPNVDFYSGIMYSALGIPVNMFTVMFALGRLPGWIAHWKEMNEDKHNRILRPRQIYTGPTLTHYQLASSLKKPNK